MIAAPAHRRTPRTLAACLLSAAALSGGCFFNDARFEQTTNIPAPTGEIHALDVQSRNGSIAVHRADAMAITAKLRMTTQERLGQATVIANVGNDGLLTIRAEPPAGGWKNSEGCSFDVALPLSVPVHLTTGNGEISCRGMSGRGEFRTSNGGVEVYDHDGQIKAETSNGGIEIRNASGPVDAETSNGGVRVALAATSPGPVHIETSNGQVSLEVAQSFTGTLEIHTSNGSISLPSGTGIQSGRSVSILQHERNDATIQFGQGGPKSEIHTSNGGVSVKF